MMKKLFIIIVLLSCFGYAAPIYVSKTGNDSNTGLSWDAAKATIQAGVNAQTNNGEKVVVGDGTYTLSSSINVSNAIIIESQTSANKTIINGNKATRCIWIGDISAKINNLTIKNGSGGGIYCQTYQPEINHCIISDNSAINGGGIFNGTANNCIISGNYAENEGGGMNGGIANNCIIYSNRADWYGGGLAHCSANNCTITKNSVQWGSSGGGVYSCMAKNCIIYYNGSRYNYPNVYHSYIDFCCSPDVSQGQDCIYAAPQFAGALNFQLMDLSPCIDAGKNTEAYIWDFDGNPRIVDGNDDGVARIDMGAYEYQIPEPIFGFFSIIGVLLNFKIKL